MTSSVHLVAPAKLTWFLEVTGRRVDGYHELRSEMVSLDLADELELRVDGKNEFVQIETNNARTSVPLEPTNNLVVRALNFAGREASVRLRKQIPIGGGLGGGSSDAGAVLRWAGVSDVASAVVLGGDVPFCIHGGRAMVRGVGEHVEPLPYEERVVTLVIPPFAINTAHCYRAFDELVSGGWKPSGRNHLFEPAKRVEPRLEEAAQWLAARYGVPVELCGSGSTLFIEGSLDSTELSWDVKSPVGILRFQTATTTPRQDA